MTVHRTIILLSFHTRHQTRSFTQSIQYAKRRNSFLRTKRTLATAVSNQDETNSPNDNINIDINNNTTGPTSTVKDYAQNWDAQYTALMATVAAAKASLTPDHWHATERLLQSHNHKHRILTPRRIHQCFQLLDALCDHVKNDIDDDDDRSKTNTNALVRAHLDRATLNSLLIAWRDHIFASLEEQHQQQYKNTNTNTLSKQQSSPSDQQDHVLPDPSWVLSRIHEYTDNNKPHYFYLVEPHESYYNMILHVMAKQQCPPEWGEDLIQTMIDKSRRQHAAFHPTATTVYGMMELWAQQPSTTSSFSTTTHHHHHRSSPAQRAEHYWSLLHETWSTPEYRTHHGLPLDTDILQDVHPNMYCALMEAYSRHEAGETAFPRIQELYAQLLQRQSNGNAFILETAQYNRIVRAFGSCRHADGADAARAILDQLCQNLARQQQDGTTNDVNNHLAKPDTFTFLAVLTAYARKGRARDAEALFAHMKELAAQYGQASLIPNIPCYNALVWAYAKVGESHKAEAVLTEMATAFGTDLGAETNETAIDWTTWNGVLASWAESDDPNAMDQIAAVIRRLEQMAGEGTIPFQALNANMYNKVLGGYAKKQSRERFPESAQKAEALFHWMKKQGELNPNMIPDEGSHYNLILAFANARQPEKSHEYLHQLCDFIRDKGTRIDQKSVAIVVEAWAKSRQPQAMGKAKEAFDLIEAFGQKPDVVSYTSLLWSMAKSPFVAKYQSDVEVIFERMNSQYKSGDSFCKPSIVTYSAVLYALCHSGNDTSFAKATDLFQKIRSNQFPGIAADTALYNMLMHAFATRQQPEQMEQLYQELKTISHELGNESLQINSNVLVTRLQGWSQAGNPEMTSEALQDMIAAHRAGIIERQPDTREFTALLQAWLRSRRPNAAEKAEVGLYQMMDFAKSKSFDCQPNIFSFVAVISAHAKSSSPEAGKKAFMLFRQMVPNGVEPNLLAYTEVILALCRSSNKNQRDPGMMESLNKALQQLFLELASKESRFWYGEKMVDQQFDRIRNGIHYSCFPHKQDLLATFHTLDSRLPKRRN